MQISPLDSRYADRLERVAYYFSEEALMRSRCEVELRYVLALNKTGLFEALSKTELENINDCLSYFSDADYQRIKAIEGTTRHDVKACEIFLRERTQLQNENLLHFALTSEDVNNLAYTFLLRDYWKNTQMPQLKQLIEKLCALAERWKTIPFPCRTHGQKASPSTAGKELAVFINRLLRIYEQLKNFRFSGKINGAVGNYSAMLAAFPNYDWLSFAHQFLQQNQLTPNIATTQIEDHDTWATYFNLTRQVNNIVMDLDTDCWLYISYDLFSEKANANEVGSSTMPHKVNPINFENSEGNLSIANSLLTLLSDKLCRSRMQRDLSDSTVQRNIGVAMGHGYLAIAETMRGLDKLQINEQRCLNELADSPELLTEPIQTILKTVGIKDPYTLLKNASRGQRPSRQSLLDLVNTLPIDAAVKQRIEQLTPANYIGDAVRICDLVLQQAIAITSSAKQ